MAKTVNGRLVVLTIIALGLAVGAYLRFGLFKPGTLDIRNTGTSPLTVTYSAAGVPAVNEHILSPGETIRTTFRAGAVISIWPGNRPEGTPASWLLSASGKALDVKSAGGEIEIAGDGLQASPREQ